MFHQSLRFTTYNFGLGYHILQKHQCKWKILYLLIVSKTTHYEFR